MKKLFSMLLFVAAASFATSCDEVESLTDDLDDLVEDVLGDTSDMDEYTGTMTVTSGTYTLYTKDNAKFYTEVEDGELEILMKEVKFVESMDVTLDITVSGIEIGDDGAFSVDSIVPTIQSIQMEAYTMSGVAGTYTDSTLAITFTCDIENMGECTVTYEGSIE